MTSKPESHFSKYTRKRYGRSIIDIFVIDIRCFVDVSTWTLCKTKTKVMYLLTGSEKDKLKFMTSGNAIFTISNPVTKRSFTYKWIKNKNSERWNCKVLSRPSNTEEESYVFIGQFSFEHGFKWSPRSKYSADALSVLSIEWVCKRLLENTFNITNKRIYRSGYCGRCGRPLTTAKSLETGYGRECERIGVMNGTIIISDNKQIQQNTILPTVKQLKLFE